MRRGGLGDLGKREIGPRFEDSEKLTRRDLRSLRDKFASSLIGFVFPASAKSFIFIILC